MPADKKSPDQILLQAVEISDLTDRKAFLDEVCAEDTALRAEVDSLLAAYVQSGDFLDSPPVDVEVTLEAASPAEGIGMTIGRYKLLENIGEGGMATVYMAEQKRPIRRRVAVKLIKLGMDSKQVIARFEAERQALALMDHPNIAKVLDAGTTDTGRPYFVMELVRGIAITEFCDQNHLTTRERLELFISVCQAVHHAHQKGIIHRDIKPSNVLVTLHDGEPVVKVIDFGIAKAMNQQLTEKTVFTQFSQMIGTPQYMSPEQAEMSGLDVDTRTDVFSLGVLLYELLTGTTPFDSEYLLSKGYGELQRIIREEEPVRPSTKISTMGDALTDVAKHRRTSPQLLCKLIRTDMDWIVMKTLEKDRKRRYESVNDFAADIKRHLNNEPVLAGRPSAIYKVQKFVKRNKVLVTSAAIVTVILMLATTISLWQMIRANLAAQKLGMEKSRAVAAEDAAKQERDRAQENLYDSLVGEASATRTAREAGYRAKVFGILQRAQELGVSKNNIGELRREAVACMGDPVGIEPTPQLQMPQWPNESIILDVTLHPTDSISAFGLSTGDVVLKDLRSAKEIARFEYEHPCVSLSFAESGKTLLSLHIPRGDSSTGLQFDAAVTNLFVRAQDGSWIKRETKTFPYAVRCMSTMAGFNLIVVNKPSRSAYLADLLTGEKVHELDFSAIGNVSYETDWGSQESQPLPVDLSKDGRYLVTETFEPDSANISVLDIWDITQDQAQHLRRLKPNLGVGRFVEFSPDGQYLVYISVSGGIVYSTESYEPIGYLPGSSGGYKPVFLPNTALLAYAKDQMIFLWDCQKRQSWDSFKQASEGARSICVSGDGKTLMTYTPKAAFLYSLATPTERMILSGHNGPAPNIDYSPDGTHLASVGKDRTLRFWDTTTGEQEWKQTLEDIGQGVTYSADGRWLVTTEIGRERICIWSTETTDLLLALGSERKVHSWSPELTDDLQYLITANSHQDSGPGSLTVWRCDLNDPRATNAQSTPKELRSFPGHIGDVALAPTNRHIAFTRSKETWETQALFLYDLAGTEEPRLLANDIYGSNQKIDFTPDSRQILVVDANLCIVTYDVQSGQKVASFPTLEKGAAGQFETYSWWTVHKLSPDGTTMAMTSPRDLGVDLWDCKSGQLLYSLPRQDGFVFCFAWSPDGQRLAISGTSENIEIWNIAQVDRVLSYLGLAP